MSNKKHSNSVWEEQLWGQIGAELSSNVLLLSILKLLSFYYHQSPNNQQITENAFRGGGRIWLITRIEQNRMNRKLSVVEFYTDCRTRFE
jgi:hypothetical protein